MQIHGGEAAQTVFLVLVQKPEHKEGDANDQADQKEDEEQPLQKLQKPMLAGVYRINSFYWSLVFFFQNWMQYQLTVAFLREIREDQTLVMQSGHPLGLRYFPEP